MSIRLVCSLSLLLLIGPVGIACAAHEAFTDPAKAGPDFAVQGEYAGSAKRDGAMKKVGVQVVALGDHRFDATLFVGGLPGDGWSRGDKSENAKGRTSGNATELTGQGWKAAIDKGVMTLTGAKGEKLGKLKKVDRKSPTLGAKPPRGAIVLFDGADTAAWNDGKIVAGHWLAVGPTSKRKFGDFTLHLEFRCPFMPTARGQGRGNSGVYLQDRYETQVLDSFGLPGLDNDCGAIYQIAKEKVNMSFPPLAWQTYDIEFKAARVDAQGHKTSNARTTIKHNGVVVHDDLELPHVTPGGVGNEKAAAGSKIVKGSLYLQDHNSDPVVFRNIWIIEKK